MKSISTSCLLCAFYFFSSAQAPSMSSPDKRIVVNCQVDKMTYTISYDGKVVMSDSKLGLVREDGDFSKKMKLIKVSSIRQIKDSYIMLTAKKKNITYTANEQVFETETASGKKMNIIFRVSNDGVAFQYEFPEQSSEVKRILSEETSFHFIDGTRAWPQPKTEAQEGWEHTYPSYEAHYQMDIATG